MMAKLNRIGIVGMGPVGSILATHLKEAGMDVAIYDHNKLKMNLVKSEGIVLEGVMKKKTFIKNVFTTLEELDAFNPDIIFVCIKTTQLPALVKELSALKRSKPGIICAMNGIDVEKIISAELGENRTFRMVINFAGNLIAQNVTRVTFFNPPNYLAPMEDSGIAMSNEIAHALTGIGLDTKALNPFEILGKIWEKTILNSSLSALCAVGRMTIKEAMSNPDTVELIEQIIMEAVDVAAAEKIKFDDDFNRKCLRYLHKAGNHFPSLAVDLLNNKPTEIDYMNGKIVQYGRKHYIRTSLNLTFSNMVKAMSNKSYTSIVNAATTALDPKGFSIENGKSHTANHSGNYFLGVDLGSAYIKFTVVDEHGKVAFQTVLKTMNRDRISVHHVIETLKQEYSLALICGTGYGRKHLAQADLVKTELNCAAMAVSKYYSGAKNIIDIGGEDIKIIKCNDENNIENFYLNDKCAAGTGSFITEVAERGGINIADMSDLAAKSSFQKELNSFCTVFAKTEIMSWLFDGLPVEDIAKGIYLSILTRVIKLRIDPASPIFLIGGVIAWHPYLKTLLQEKLQKEVQIIDNPQLAVSFGAALFAREAFQKGMVRESEVQTSTSNT